MLIERINYKGWPNCYRLSNGVVDLVVTTDVGPRVIRFGFVGQGNEFAEFAEMLGKTGGDEWRLYGGHRLWHAPETMGRTYFPDNDPVKLVQKPEIVRLIQPTEPTTGIQKEIDIRLLPQEARVEVTHRLRNQNLWAVELAPWALSVMAPGGTAVVPLPPRRSHEEQLQPASTLTLWAYTNMSDPRWRWGQQYVMLRQDANATTPQKAGVMCLDGWAAYARNGHLFVKRFEHQPDATYPDLGSSVEIFTDPNMLEVETLAPLVSLAPGATVEHLEQWHLFPNVPQPSDESDVQREILPKIEALSRKTVISPPTFPTGM